MYCLILEEKDSSLALFNEMSGCLLMMITWCEQKGNTFRCSMEFRKHFTRFIELATRSEMNLSSHFQYLCEIEALMRKTNSDTLRIFKDCQMDILRSSENIIDEIIYKRKMN